MESKKIINLDNCNDNSRVIGADGDICNKYTFEGKRIKLNKDTSSYKVKIYDFPEGNSGMNIELSEDNAITTMAKLLDKKDVLLTGIKGGTFENDLASFCEIVVNTNLDIHSIFKNVNSKIEKIDNNISFSREDTKNIINEILELKCGYLSNKEVSANLGIIDTKEEKVEIYYVFRSMSDEKLQETNSNTRNLNNKFLVEELYRDSIWHPNEKSKLLEAYKKIYFEKYKEYPITEICHAGLECSIFKKRIQDLDIISNGSTIEDFHTTEEKTYISSMNKIYYLLISLLERI